MSNGNTLVYLEVSGPPAKGYCGENLEDPFTDTRWRPFEITGPSPEIVSIKLDTWKGPAYLFDRLREIWDEAPEDNRWGAFPFPRSPNEYAASVNMWLAILDHFGLDVPYTKHFLGLIRHSTLEILSFAYRKDPSESPNDHRRYFNGRAYDNPEFQREFNKFLLKNHLLF